MAALSASSSVWLLIWFTSVISRVTASTLPRMAVKRAEMSAPLACSAPTVTTNSWIASRVSSAKRCSPLLCCT